MKTAAIGIVMIVFSASLHAQLADFTTADSIAALYSNHSLQDLQRLAHKLTASLQTEEEKFRSIHTWVCSNIEYDYSLYLVNKKKREQFANKPKEMSDWNKKFRARVFKKLLYEKKTICTGYAYLIRELAIHAGIACVIIDGYGRTVQSNIGGAGTPNHSWNGVRLNGKWYLCDATWSSGAIDSRSGIFYKKYENCFFLSEPSLFIRNHYPLDSAWMLLPNKPTLHEFLNRPVAYNGMYKHKIDRLFPETFDISATKGKAISFGFRKKGNTAIKMIELSIDGLKPIAPSLYTDTDGTYCMNHIFVSKGTHVIHVLLDSSYGFTYAIKVK
jgi:hypothetical protein